MSLFVLVYDRTRHRVVELREFPEADIAGAHAFRLGAQRHAIHQGLDEEIVLFQAASEESLKRTHGSYFLSEQELMGRMREATETG